MPNNTMPAVNEVYKAPHAGGRPTKYSVALSETICSRIATGDSLNTICTDIGIPYITIVRWIEKHDEFRKKYMRARDLQADFYADELRDIAYAVPATRDEVEKAKLKSNNLMWIASKLKPKKYGDKLDLTSDGERIEQPIYGGLSVAKDKKQVIEGEVVKTKPKQLDKTVKPKRV